jgi:site-specific recombinase XerD
MKKHKEWKLVRNIWISAQAVLPGVWERKEGGHVVRGAAVCPRTGKRKDLLKVLPNATAEQALVWLRTELKNVRTGAAIAPQYETMPFGSYAVSLLKRKIERGEIRSASGIEKWNMVLKHLIASSLAEIRVDQLRPRDVESWKDEVAVEMREEGYSPNTANTWLSVLRVILAHAKLDYELRESAATGVKNFDTSEHRTYTREQPNSLTADEVRKFLAVMLEKYPQHFAMTYVGCATGLRPSSLRPLRRRGVEADVKWDESVLCVRRSHTRGQAVMNRTKTKKDLEIKVPELLLEVLRWHVQTQLLTDEQKQSDLLFPREDGGLRDPKVLRSPFEHVTKLLSLEKRITPRAMRRSFQDLARSARVDDVVTRSISGHATEQMQRHYSTVSEVEQSEGLAKVLRMMDFRERKSGIEASVGACVGALGSEAPKTTTADIG